MLYQLPQAAKTRSALTSGPDWLGVNSVELGLSCKNQLLKPDGPRPSFERDDSKKTTEMPVNKFRTQGVDIRTHRTR
jgi:hypothetical protein